MKRAKIFIVFTFLFAFAVSVSAQNYFYSNELENFKLVSDSKLNQLKLLISTKENVATILDDSCKEGCEFNDKWNVGFQFISEKDDLYGKPYPKDLIGKLYAIEFYPRNKILLDKLNFSGKFKLGFEGIDEPTSDLRTYRDKLGLSYTVGKNFKKWEVINIRYGISDKEFKDLLKQVKDKK